MQHCQQGDFSRGPTKMVVRRTNHCQRCCFIFKAQKELSFVISKVMGTECKHWFLSTTEIVLFWRYRWIFGIFYPKFYSIYWETLSHFCRFSSAAHKEDRKKRRQDRNEARRTKETTAFLIFSDRNVNLEKRREKAFKGSVVTNLIWVENGDKAERVGRRLPNECCCFLAWW